MSAKPKSVTVGPIEATGRGLELGGAADQLCIKTICTLAMDAVQQADSGHPGTPMALAPVAYTLWQPGAIKNLLGRDQFVYRRMRRGCRKLRR
jgi:hypothetical protein